MGATDNAGTTNKADIQWRDYEWEQRTMQELQIRPTYNGGTMNGSNRQCRDYK